MSRRIAPKLVVDGTNRSNSSRRVSHWFSKFVVDCSLDVFDGRSIIRTQVGSRQPARLGSGETRVVGGEIGIADVEGAVEIVTAERTLLSPFLLFEG